MANPTIPVEGEFTLFRPKQFGKGLRRARRYRSGLATIGKICFPNGAETLEASVQNLSKTGIGLNLSQPLEIGQELAVRLRVPGELNPRKFLLRVIHSTQEIDRSWRVGGEFVEPLTAELLELLLQ